MDNKRFITRLMVGVRIYFAVIILFILLTVIARNYYLAIGEFFVLLLLYLYYITNKKTKQEQITSYIENLNFHLDNATKDSMITFPMPLTVLSLSGTVVWYNKKFGDIIKVNAFEKLIQEVIPDIQILKILENKNHISFFVNHEDRYYQVVGNVVEFMNKQTKSFSIVLYWIDRTAERDSIEYSEKSQALSCILMVDNYEDLIKNTPDNQIAKLTASISEVINEWVMKIGGVLRKYDNDKYFIVFPNESLQMLIDDKFDILDTAHEINDGNKISVTLSIGIGKGETIQQSDELARTSIDMALGRGGDQAVIKDNEQFRFFGGRSEGIEKNTKVKARVVAFALRELIEQADEVFIMGHKNPDADSIGAAVGLCRMTLNRNIKAHIVIENIFGASLKIVQSFEGDENYKDVFITEAQALQMYTGNSLLIIVDTHNPNYIESIKLVGLIKNKVLIDHHRRGKEFIESLLLTYHEPYASSASEMVTEIIQYMEEDPHLSVNEAQSLYAGIALDTKNFSQKTGVRTFEAASFLRRMGVDTVCVKKMFQSDLIMYTKKAKIVSNAEIYKKVVAISVWNENEEYANILASQAADELLNISEVTASFVLCKSDNLIVISGRSYGSYNVQIVLEQLGGGGHMTIAGAQLHDITMDNALDMLKKAIDSEEQ